MQITLSSFLLVNFFLTSLLVDIQALCNIYRNNMYHYNFWSINGWSFLKVIVALNEKMHRLSG